MKNIVLLFSLAFTLSLSSIALGGSSSGKVDTIYSHAPQFVFFSVGVIANPIICPGRTVFASEYAIDISTDFGQATYALLLSAKARGTDVIVSGKGNCDAWGDRESVTWVRE